jgi:tRNA/tmRNA/rRNA uracil-C5-methylase (TrmA/RlmC/RlmD family)
MQPSTLRDEYARHLVQQEARVRALLSAHGLEALFHGLEPCIVEQGYRTQASFRAVRDSSTALYVGVDPRLGRVAMDDSLWVLPGPARPVALRVRDLVREMGVAEAVTGFDLRLEHGSLRAHVSIAAPREGCGPLNEFAGRLMDELPGLHGVSVPSQGIEMGEEHLHNLVCGKTVLAHHLAFFQTNAHLTPLLAAEAQRGVSGAKSVVDLYCGVGLHSVLAAGERTAIRGADNNRWAIESAERNVRLHGFGDAEYHRVTAERFASTRHFDAPGVVFVNPSRFGCGPGIPAAVARWRPAVVCLVSCSAESHVRDLLAFMREGYRPRAVRCFDMFPFTAYVENVTHLVPG